MLEHTLKNLSVYRDSKPKHDRIQTPYAGRQKRVGQNYTNIFCIYAQYQIITEVTFATQIKALPRLRPIKQQTERVDAMITDIKESTTIKGSSLSMHIPEIIKVSYLLHLLLTANTLCPAQAASYTARMLTSRNIRKRYDC